MRCATRVNSLLGDFPGEIERLSFCGCGIQDVSRLDPVVKFVFLEKKRIQLLI